MSKTDEVRAEIVGNLKASEKEAFLAGVIRAAGSVALKKRGVELVLETDKPDLAGAVKPILVSFGATELRVSRKKEGPKSARITMTVGERDSETLLRQLGILGAEGFLPEPAAELGRLRTREERLGFLKGVFSAAGTVSLTDGAEKQGYFLEMTLSAEATAAGLVRLLEEFGLDKWHLIPRKYNYGVYLKDRECISDFLVLTGATKNALKLFSAIALKDLRNNLNRQTNVQAANLDKTVIASQDTIRDIAVLKEAGIFETLSEPLRSTAQLRAEFPELSMTELADKAGVSKSGLMHRLNRLKTLAREARK